MTLTKEEKTVLITIVAAAIAGLLVSLFFSYSKKIEVKSKNTGVLLVNINTADESEFDKLPGVGKVLAERIVKYREKKGGFRAIEEIKGVKGITAKKFEQIKKYLIITEE